MESEQLSQKLYHDNRSRERSFSPEEKVYVREAGNNSPWIAGVIESKLRSVHYDVKLEDGRLVKRHIDHIQPRSSTDVPEEQQDEDIFDQIDIPPSSDSTSPTAPLSEASTQEVPRNPEPPRCSKRIRYPPVRYEDPQLI